MLRLQDVAGMRVKSVYFKLRGEAENHRVKNGGRSRLRLFDRISRLILSLFLVK